MKERHQRIAKLVHVTSVHRNAIPGGVAMTAAWEAEARQRWQSSESCGWDAM